MANKNDSSKTTMFLDEANEKASMAIINVNQFFPEITSDMRVVKDKFSFLADNIMTFDSPSSSVPEKEDTIRQSDKPQAENGVSGKSLSSIFQTTPEDNPTPFQHETMPETTELVTEVPWPVPIRSPLPTMSDVLNTRCAEHYQDAKLAMKNGDWERSLNHFTKCICLKPNDPSYYVNRGEVFFQLCDFQSAILNYKRACLLDATNMDYNDRLAFLYVFYGQTLFDQKLYPEALEAFSRACELQPNNAQYRNRSIACLAAFHRHSDCLELVNQKLDQEPDNVDLLVLRARLHYLFRNYKLCYFDLQDVLLRSPSHEAALTLCNDLRLQAENCKNRSVKLGLLGRDQEAHNKISLAIEMDPTQGDYHVKRGGFRRRLGDFAGAIDDYLIAMDKVEHDETSPIHVAAQRQILVTFNDLAVECFHHGRYEEAIGLMNRAIHVEKKEIALYLNRGDCFYKAGFHTFALEDYQQALEMDPQSDMIHTRIALVHHSLSQIAFSEQSYEEVVDYLLQAIRHDPTVHFYWTLLARAKYALNSLNESREASIISVMLMPNQEELASLVARLFPGKTNSDVMKSSMAEQAKKEFFRVYNERYPHKNGEELFSSHAPSEGEASKASSKKLQLKELHSKETTQFLNIIEEKKAIHKAVKTIFNERNYKKPKIKISGPGSSGVKPSVAERHNWTSMLKGSL